LKIIDDLDYKEIQYLRDDLEKIERSIIILMYTLVDTDNQSEREYIQNVIDIKRRKIKIKKQIILELLLR
jgi:hypothetical protein